MVKPEMYHVSRKISYDELEKHIKNEKSAKVLKRLLFIKYRYDGNSVDIAAKMIEVTKMVGYIWQNRWNDDGYNGIIPRYHNKGPSKMSDEQRELLKALLRDGEYTTAQVRNIIKEEFGIEYTMKQVWVILKRMGMHHAKPYPHDKRRPGNAEDVLKKN